MQKKIYYICVKKFKFKKISYVISCIVAYIFRFASLILLMLYQNNDACKITRIEARSHLIGVSSKSNKERVTKNKWIKTNSIDISIIIPAYNAEETIVRCLESVKLTTKYSAEIIIIDDGSTDHTAEILLAYNNCENLHVITQENQGFSGARNTGIIYAKGQYIMFLDADDELEKSSIEALMDTGLKYNAAIVAGAYSTIYGEKAIHSSLEDVVIDSLEDGQGLQVLGGFAWGKIIKRSLFEDIYFPEGYLFEDSIMAFLIYRRACGMTVASISDRVYRYYKNDKGITATYHKTSKCVDAYWIVEKMYEETIRVQLPLNSQLFELVLAHLKLTYWRTIRLDNDSREYVFVLSAELMNQVMQYKSNRKYSFYERQLLHAYKAKNYKLWKLCSFVLE